MAKKTNTVVADIHNRLGIAENYANTCGLPVHHEPAELADAGRDMFDRPLQMTPDTLQAWRRMQAAAQQDGIVLQVVSAFRSIAYQADLIARKVAAGRTLQDVLSVNAAPGFSEHHSGRALDIATPGCKPLEREFDQTQAFTWLQQHAAEFGFVMSYPEGSSGIISYEPWHWCYQPELDNALGQNADKRVG